LRHKFFSLLDGVVVTDAETEAAIQAEGAAALSRAGTSTFRWHKHNRAKGALPPEEAAVSLLPLIQLFLKVDGLLLLRLPDCALSWEVVQAHRETKVVRVHELNYAMKTCLHSDAKKYMRVAYDESSLEAARAFSCEKVRGDYFAGWTDLPNHGGRRGRSCGTRTRLVRKIQRYLGSKCTLESTYRFKSVTSYGSQSPTYASHRGCPVGSRPFDAIAMGLAGLVVVGVTIIVSTSFPTQADDTHFFDLAMAGDCTVPEVAESGAWDHSMIIPHDSQSFLTGRIRPMNTVTTRGSAESEDR
jgi:hypothetical protein